MEVHQAVPADANYAAAGEGSRSSSGCGGEVLARFGGMLCAAVGKVRAGLAGVGPKLARVARDDPRRVTHSLKVGLALTLVSILYYVRPIFNSWGVSTMWAVLTVVVVMEYTVGGTLIKGMNRALATLVAGFTAVGAHKIAYLCGHNAEPVVLAIFVFIIASAATFTRFIPAVKARYDYGVTIFILTFSLVAVSSYRVDELIRLAHQRSSTIAIGVTTCLLTTAIVCPVWAGEDLHNLTAGNLDKLAQFLEGMESEYFGESATGENLESKPFLQLYKSVLNSKAIEDSLSNFAKWEPAHGKFKYRYPYGQYQKIGAVYRQCASSMETLASYIITLTKTQYPQANSEQCLRVRTECGVISLHLAKTLRELSDAIRMMIVPSAAKIDMSAAIRAAKALRAELSEDPELAKVMHVAVIASLLSELVAQTKKITESVDNLARLAGFENPDDTQSDVVIHVVS